MSMKVSCYIPCYNGAAHLPALVECLRQQTVAIDDLFVVDDGSTDNSVAVCKSIGVTVIENSQNMGRGFVRALAMTTAKHEFVFAFDLTNHYSNDFVERALQSMQPSDVAAVCGMICSPDSPSLLGRWQDRHIFQYHLREKIDYNAKFATYACVCRKSLVMEVGNYDQTLRAFEDADLGRRLKKANYRVIQDPELQVISIATPTPARVLERYWRWFHFLDRPSLKFLLEQIYYSAKVMAVKDCKAGDYGAIFITLVLPYYCFIKTCLKSIK